MAKTYVEQLEEIAVKAAEMKTVFDEAGEAYDMSLVESIKGDDVQTTEDVVKWIQERELELADLNEAAQGTAELMKSSENNQQLLSVLDLLKMPSNALAEAINGAPESKGGTTFSKALKEQWDPSMKGRDIELSGVDEVKTLFETTAGWLPESTRTGKVVDAVTRPLQISDTIPFTTTSEAAVVYMEETTRTNAAAGVAEGGAFPESAYELTERVSPVQKIATFIPVTDEQLEDVPEAGGYLNNRLSFGLRQTLDDDLLTGDGIAPNLEGLLNRTGIQTYALSGEPVPDALYKGMDLVSVTGRAIPNAFMIHSTDWQSVRLLRTADGIYIWGSPSEVGASTMWGLPVVINQVVTVGTAFVGDFANFSEFAVKRGVTVKVSDSHSDYFTNGKQAIRADMRGALQCYRPAAFATITNL